MILKIWSKVRSFNKRPYFGFIQGHSYLNNADFNRLNGLIDRPSNEVVENFESKFALLVGDGYAVSYAAARMAFYDLMKNQGIGPGDEVILLGSTCAVMVNAVIRVGATPIFSDIDKNTFGSSYQSISDNVTEKTRMIVVQHSFGIPCDVMPIKLLAKKRKIFLLEDCALTIGSKIRGISVGNFGDAAIFSTDHSKPINTLIGGFIYTRDSALANSLRASRNHCLHIPVLRQKALLKRLKFESTYCNPEKCGRFDVIDLLKSIFRLGKNSKNIFLNDDFGLPDFTSYPYPAPLPSFLAGLGLIELERWPDISRQRMNNLTEIIRVFKQGRVAKYLPSCYDNLELEIIPLRFVWSQPDGSVFREKIRNFIHVQWTWFLQPVIASRVSIDQLFYKWGSCPVSENLGPNMINIPCNVTENDFNQLLVGLRKVIA